MSSTTEHRAERGQALVIFAMALVGLLLMAALAFDIGWTMLERRTEQNAADAAALGGVRFLPSTGTAIANAVDVARENGYENGVDDTTVTVSASSVQVTVTISRESPSFFARVIGIDVLNPRARAVAIKAHNAPPFGAMIALSPDACPAVNVTGTGVVNSNGDIQVNSECASPDGVALQISGQGNINLNSDTLACYVVGDANLGGRAEGELCVPPEPGSPVDWPIGGSPANLDEPDPIQEIGTSGLDIPNGCPGSETPATDDAPATCQFTSNYDGSTWRLFPGYYPGGIKLQAGTFYMEPGIYHMAGGGFTSTATGVTLTSVAPGGTTLGGGVLIYNATHAIAANGSISMGGNGNQFQLYPNGGLNLQCNPDNPPAPWERYVIFQDPAITNEIVINGGDNVSLLRGMILAPTANVKLNGGTGTLVIDAVIANTFLINGNGGNINVLYESCALPVVNGYGLINNPTVP